MSNNKEQSVAALNTLINLALQVANTQQQQVQNAANVLAQALELGPADTASEETEVEEPKVVTTDCSAGERRSGTIHLPAAPDLPAAVA